MLGNDSFKTCFLLMWDGTNEWLKNYPTSEKH